MKQTIFRPLIAFILLMSCTLGYAQKFEIEGLTYNVIDESNRYVEVVGGADTKIVKIPSTVTRGGVRYTVISIGGEAFLDWGLTSITIPSSVKSIGESAFGDCSSLTSITIPSSVKSIGDCAFEFCSRLTSINIPSSVKSIGKAAFGRCYSLTSITIPNSVTSIGEGAFSLCGSLTQIQVAPDNSVYDSRDNCNAIIETSSNTLISGCETTIIPNSVTSIGNLAFTGCWSLISINIPSSVTSIGVSVFWGCSSLTSINIPSNVKSIGESAFWGCSSLRSITIPSSVTSIGKSAFYDCSSLTSITLPKHITNIDELSIPEGVKIIRR